MKGHGIAMAVVLATICGTGCTYNKKAIGNEDDKVGAIRMLREYKERISRTIDIWNPGKSVGAEKTNAMVGEKWDIYIGSIDNPVGGKSVAKRLKKIDITPAGADKSSEMRIYDPHLRIDEQQRNAYILVEPCYFKGEPRRYDCDIQEIRVELAKWDSKEILRAKGKILVDPEFKVSFPQVYEVGKRRFMSLESGQEKSVYSYEIGLGAGGYKIGRQKKVITAREEIYDPIVFSEAGKAWLLANTKDRLVVCEAELGRMGMIADTVFKWDTDCKEHELGLRRYERNAGTLFRKNGAIYRFTMNNSESYGKSIDLTKITRLDKNDFRQELVENDFAKASIESEISGAVKYHHASIVKKKGAHGYYIAIDAAVPTYTYTHGKKFTQVRTGWNKIRR